MLGLRDAVAGSPIGRQGLDELRKFDKLCRAAGYDGTASSIDSSVVRGLEYYTGPVYEVELTFSVTDENGQADAVRLGRRRRAL